MQQDSSGREIARVRLVSMFLEATRIMVTDGHERQPAAARHWQQ